VLSTTRLTVPVAAIQGGYGQRLLTYATQIKPRDLEAFLGHDPRSRHWRTLDPDLEAIYKQLQRTTSADRLKQIQAYIQKRFTRKAIAIGAFPSLSVAVKRHLRFEPYEAAGAGNQLAGAGILHLELSKMNSRIVLDGLARVSGVIELVEMANREDLTAEGRDALNELLEGFALPMVVFSPRDESRPLELSELRQLFADFNFKQKSISATMAMSHDSSDIYVEATKRLGRTAVIASHGGMEKSAASLGAKSTALVVLQNLVRFTRAAAEGDRFAEAKMNVDLADESRRLDEDGLDDFVHRAEHFLGGMAEAMGPVRFADTKTAVHLTGPGWGALGAVFYDLEATLGRDDLIDAGRRLGQLDWRKSAPYWADIVRERATKSGTALAFVGGGHETRQAIRRKMHEHLGTWDDFQAAVGREAEAAEVAAAAE